MDNDPKVAIIVLNWNGFDDTARCLESLRDISYKYYKVVVVDNGSGNNEGKRLKDMFPEVQLIQNRANRGFAGGNNDGMNWALANSFDYIVNLNNDCIVEKPWLSNLIRGLKCAGADFGSSRIMFYAAKDLICSDGDILLPDGSGIPENRNRLYSEIETGHKIFSACGAGSVYSKRCLLDARIKNNQFFDELYFAFYEDIDLGIRLNLKSYKGASISDAVVYHRHSATAGKYSGLKIFHSEKNRILNEILNYPIYLIFIGETFFLFKISLLTLYAIFRRRGKGEGYLKNVGIIDMTILLVKARVWVIVNIPLILKDRLERKQKGFISSKILKFFCWRL